VWVSIKEQNSKRCGEVDGNNNANNIKKFKLTSKKMPKPVRFV
jgi:hypothetical protein